MKKIIWKVVKFFLFGAVSFVADMANEWMTKYIQEMA